MDIQEDTGFGGLNGGNIKIAPPNRFARLKTLSCNCQFEKLQTLFLKKSLLLGRKWIFFGGGSIEGAPKMVFGTIPCFLAIPETRSEMSKSRIHHMPEFYSAFLVVGNH